MNADRRSTQRSAGQRDAAAAFSAFPAEAAAAMRHCSTHRHWRNGDLVLRMGEVVPYVLTVLRGRLRISATSEEGNEVFLRWYMPGAIVGLASAMDRVPFPVDAVALDGCETLLIGCDDMQAIAASDAQAALAIARILARHVCDMVNLVTARTEHALGARVFAVIKHLAVLNGAAIEDGAFKLAISQRDIASSVGASRQRVNAELRVLEEQGRIERGYGHIIVRP